MRPEDDPRWHAYAESVLEFRPEGSEAPVLRHGVREPLTPGVRQALAALGLPPAFAILTACNPRGVELPAVRNDARHAALVERLRAWKVAFVRTDGVSPDGTHREIGVSAALALPAARDLARELEQSAIYWVDASGLAIVPVLVDAERIPLG